MKICWDNIENCKLNTHGNLWDSKKKVRYYIRECITCSEEYITQNKVSNFCTQRCKKMTQDAKHRMSMSKIGNTVNVGRHLSEEHKRKVGIAHSGERNYNWRGGVSKNRTPLYDTFFDRLSYCEEIRRDPEHTDILQVKCFKCKKWFVPRTNNIFARLSCLNGKLGGESHFYCSSWCKDSCSVYHSVKYPRGYAPNNSRPDQNDWRDLVLRRDNYKCVKCGSSNGLIAHHREGIRWNPIESADIDMGITLCRSCEKEVHSKRDCRMYDMKCN